ncbi:presenilin family intramembrane aspartyl protease PSH [Saliphagus infecundisoli]|uniref:Presenilin family intramembrane aspartyl protease PSH n=1 Tax=Saliphagus infecundisoli TaxID=1849069 RepID=A0ABD5QAJ2_9EURY|nr:presenilin family intramembrane aspartyl protease PSH [Saliphagus infecundisoli]
MNDRTRVLVAVSLTVGLFLAVQLGALALLEPFSESGQQAVDDPENPTNSLLYFGAILVGTGVMLAAFRYGFEWLIRGLVLVLSAFLAWVVLAELLPPAISVVSLPAGIAVGIALLAYPEWYVIDAAGVLMGAGAAGLFGVSFGLLPALVLLVVLAIYDAISVYRTRHMLSLAEGVMDLKIPVVLVVPTSLSYTYLDGESAEGAFDEESDSGSEDRTQPETGEDDPEPADPERDALFVGLGDAVIPTILVASAAVFVDSGTLAVPGITVNLAALGGIVGTLAGLLVLLVLVFRGRPHAGLPLLNGGAIAGYLLGALASGLSLSAALGL